ncbi:MAG: outer membrane beta-barrel protein [Bacteroides sp.]|nr:outer membrane beta-barrel protein [Bacteroides sp.]
MKGDWTDKLKTRLEGHEMTPPSDLWTGINEQMGFAAQPARASVVAIWRWATVAAVVLVLVGFFALYENNEADYSIPNELISEEAIIPKPMEETIIEKQPIAKKQHNIIPQVKPQESVGVTIVEEYVEVVDMTAVQQEKSQKRPTTKEVVETYHHNVPIQQPKAKSKKQRLSVALNASGGLSNSKTESMHIEPVYGAAPGTPPHRMHYLGDVFEPKKVQERKASKHAFPIRLGIKLSYPLNDRLSLQSGVGYTLLKSDLSYSSMQIGQQLHYIGVPLGLRYQLWNSGRFSLYGAVGAMLEKCVKNSSELPSAFTDAALINTEKPWQCSLNAALGAEYRLDKAIGIYLEPGVGYFFEDGTSVEHYYTEHPFVPSLEIGLRWNM